ncbi:MAG TPA: hypothetical protein VK869_08395 [Rubrobacteraceae bacterium]|nr:hypothetical protein [Rubrobacteraceae bacterium]
MRKAPPGLAIRRSRANGRPALVGYFADGSSESVRTFDIARGRVQAIHRVLNPEKLGNVPPLERLDGKDDLK